MPKRKKTEGRNSVDLATDFYSNPNANLVAFESIIKSASPPRKPILQPKAYLAYKTSKIQARLEDPQTNPVIIPTLQAVGKKLGMRLTATEGYRTKAEQTAIMQDIFDRNPEQYYNSYRNVKPGDYPSKHLSKSAADIRRPEWPKESTSEQRKTFDKDLETSLKSLDFSIFANRTPLPSGKLEKWDTWAARIKQEGKKGVHVYGEGDHVHLSYTDARTKNKSILSKVKHKIKPTPPKRNK
jgi:hypothetical protein